VAEARHESAWFWVELATLPSTASEARKRVISGAAISAGWRLPWNTTKRRIHPA
jgi:hypothetical protein